MNQNNFDAHRACLGFSKATRKIIVVSGKKYDSGNEVKK